MLGNNIKIGYKERIERNTHSLQVKICYLLLATCYLLMGCSNPFSTEILPPRNQTGALVSSPVVVGLPDPESITVSEVDLLNKTYQDVEYAVSTSDNANPEDLQWQTLTTFHGLSSGTDYFVYARSKLNAYYAAGDASVSELIRFYSVFFNGNGADGGTAPASQTVLDGTVIALPDWGPHTPNALWKLQSAFGSWNTMADGTGKNFIPGSQYEVTHNQTMFVRWLDSQTYRLPYDAPIGGGYIDSGIILSQTGEYLDGNGNPYPFYAEIHADNGYENPKWFYGETPLDDYTSNGGYTLTVDARNILFNVLGAQVVRLEADRNGSPYYFNITFLIER